MPSIAADRLATVFVEVADTLTAEFDLVDFMQMLSRRCAELADVAAVGLLLADNHGRLQFIAASDEQAELLELFQLQAEQGPCLDCYHTGQPVMCGDLAGAATPWPAFAKEAQAGGFRSVHAIPLRLREQTIGALNLFNTEVGHFSPADAGILQALADVATIALLQERTIRRGEVLAEQLQSALNSRIVIEQAKGVIAQTYGMSVDDAFEMLRAHARARRQLLSDVARMVVDDPTLLGRVPAERTEATPS